jgi:cation:H+ antiporter
MISLLGFLFGLALLVFGAEVLVRGASAAAKALKVPALVIGLTVVAYGTSAPELAVSLRAALAGNSNIAVGNVVGSNIFNVLFILGLSAMVTPLAVKSRLIRLDIPVMIGVSFLLLLLALDRSVGRVEGAGLLLGLVAYTALTFSLGRREEKSRTETTIASESQQPLWRSVAYILIGLLALSVGARLLVDGAVWLADWVGVSQAVIGLVIVAAGTSIPEVVTSIIAAIRGERDIAVGNVVGSNIFNILGVLGISSVAAPEGVTIPLSIRQFDLPVLLATAVVCLPIAFTGGRISRWEGTLLLGYFAAYITYLFLKAVEHDALSPFSATMLSFVLPLTTIALSLTVVRHFASSHRRKS